MSVLCSIGEDICDYLLYPYFVAVEYYREGGINIYMELQSLVLDTVLYHVYKVAEDGGYVVVNIDYLKLSCLYF